MKLELFSAVFLLTLPGNLVASRPNQVSPTGCEIRQEQQDPPKIPRDRRVERVKNKDESKKVVKDVLLPRGARVL